MKSRDLAYVSCRAFSVWCLIKVVTLLPGMSTLFVLEQHRPPSITIFVTFFSVAALAILGVGLWFGTTFFSSLLVFPNSSVEPDIPVGITAAELKGIAFSCIGLVLVIETISAAPRVILLSAFQHSVGVPGGGASLGLDITSALLKIIIGFWLFLGAERIKRMKNYLVRE